MIFSSDSDRLKRKVFNAWNQQCSHGDWLVADDALPTLVVVTDGKSTITELHDVSETR